MGAPHEVAQSLPPWSSLAAAGAWLLGYVRTDVPGYRELVVFNRLRVAASSTGYRFDAFVVAASDALVAAGADPLTWTTTGSVTGGGNSVGCPDRLGWVLGWGVEGGGTNLDNGGEYFIPPAGIPLYSATWTEVTSDADRRQILDEHRRNQGYTWGSALIWKCKLKMHRWSLEALQIGWCLRGKVTLGCTGQLDTPVSLTEPGGAITGYVLSPLSVTWIGQAQQVAQVELNIVTA